MQIDVNKTSDDFTRVVNFYFKENEEFKAIWKRISWPFTNNYPWGENKNEDFSPSPLKAEEMHKIEDFFKWANGLSIENLEFDQINRRERIKDLAKEYLWRTKVLNTNNQEIFELAKKDAESRNLRNLKYYRGLSPSQIFEVAKIAAMNGPYSAGIIVEYYKQFSNQQLFEIAKITTQYHGPSDITLSCGIQDPAQKLELARIAAEKNPAKIPGYIRHYDIQNQDELFEIAKKAAAAKSHDLPKYIQNFEITDPLKRFELAKIVASYSYQLPSNIQNFQIDDRSQLFEICKISAANYPEELGDHLNHFINFNNQEYFEIAKIAVAKDGAKTSKTFPFKLLSQDQRIEIAKMAAPSQGASIYFAHYDIEDPELRFEIAKISAQHDSSLSMCINNYKITDQKLLKEIALIAAYEQGKETSQWISNYKIEEERDRFNIAVRAFTSKNPPISRYSNTGWNYFNGYALSMKNEINLLLILCRLDPENIFETIEKYKFNEIKKEDLKEFYGGMQLMLNPKEIPDSQDLALLGPLGQYVNESFSETSRIHMLKWLGYVLLHFRVYNALDNALFEEKQKETDCIPILIAIAKIRNPLKRYQLTSSFFWHLVHLNGVVFDVYCKLKLTNEFKRKDHLIFRLLLAELISSYEADAANPEKWSQICSEWKNVFLTLTSSTYKDCNAQMAVIQSLYTLNKTCSFKNEQNKARLILELFKTVSGVKDKRSRTKIVNRNLRLMETLINTGYCNSLEKLVALRPNALSLKKDSLQKCLQDIFKEIIGKVNIQDFDNKYETNFLQARQPDAFIIYASKLSQFNNSFQSYLQIIFTSILEGTFQQMRYNIGEHLNTVFSWRPGLKEKWIQNSCTKLKLIFGAEDEQKKKSFDVHAYLYQKICNDKHVPPENYPLLINAIKYPSKETIEETLKNINEQIEKLSTNEKLNEELTSLKFQKAILAILNSPKDLESSINLAAAFSPRDYPQFFQDLQDLIKLIKPEKKGHSEEHWVVENTDAWEDLLLSGTEVLGSCQSIYSHPCYNKCLLNYILDGKNRIVIAKDREGRIRSRILIRLLADPVLKQPVIFLERLYTTPGVPNEILEEIRSVCLETAAALKIPLVMSASQNNNPSRTFTFYPNPLVSFNALAPFEYVDANKMGITDGKFTIPPEANIYLYNGTET